MPKDANLPKVDLSLQNFPDNGCAEIGAILDKEKSSAFRSFVNEKRPVNDSIFYKSKEEFEAKGRWENYSPGRESHNFLLKPEVDLSFVEENPAFVQAMENLCGKGYQIFKKALIMMS